MLPVTPRLLLGLSRNLATIDGPPRLFARHPGTVVADGAPAHIDPRLGAFIAEGELGIVIGAPLRAADTAAASAAIAGWTIGNDITALGLVAADGYSQEGKGSETPLATQLCAPFDAADARIVVRVNGDVRAEGRMSQLGLRGAELVAWVSRTQTLLPGDVILCGAPGTATPIAAGDVVRIEVPGLGALENPIAG